MKTFADTTGRPWSIAINVNSLRRVKDDVEGFDLMRVVEDQSTINRITTDPFTQVAVLYAVCKPQAETQGVTPEQFGEAMGGDALDAGITALLVELADFFPPHRRGPMKAAIQKLHQIQQKVAQMAIAKIEAPQTEANALAALQSRLDALPEKYGSSSTSPPASQGLTPGHSHSAN